MSQPRNGVKSTGKRERKKTLAHDLGPRGEGKCWNQEDRWKVILERKKR